MKAQKYFVEKCTRFKTNVTPEPCFIIAESDLLKEQMPSESDTLWTPGDHELSMWVD